MIALLGLLASAWALDVVAPPLERGTVVTITITGGTPGGTVDLIAGPPGRGPCPAALGGACLSVTTPTLVGRLPVDATGRAQRTLAVPANAPLIDVALQAVDRAGRTLSPALVVPVLGELAVGAVLDVSTPATWRQLGHLHTVAGEVVVHDLPLATLALPSLRSVTGTLTWSSNAAHTVDLPALTTGPLSRCEAGAIDFVGNPNLTLVTAPMLTTTSWCSRGNGPVTYDLPALTTAGHLVLSSIGRVPGPPTDAVALHAPLLRSVDALDVYYTRLDALDLPSLQTASGPLQLWHNDDLVALSLPALVSAPLLVTVDDPALSSCVVDAVVAGGAVGAVDCREVAVDGACTLAGCTP